MALVATLVEQGNNRLRYLLVCDTTGVTALTLTTTGAVTPDLATDSLFGPIKEMTEAFTDGIGLLPAGVKTQAQARAIWMSDNSNAVLGSPQISRAVANITDRTGPANWSVDANVDGGGHPTLTITAGNTGSAYLDIFTQGAIGL